MLLPFAIVDPALVGVAIAHGVAFPCGVGMAIVLASLMLDLMKRLGTGDFWRTLERLGGDHH